MKADASVEVSVGAGVGAAHGHNVKYPFTFLRCWYKLFRCAGTSLHIACETLLPRVEKLDLTRSFSAIWAAFPQQTVFSNSSGPVAHPP